MKILVSGGTGFIGSAVVRYIIGNVNDAMVNLDKLTYASNIESLAGFSDSERYAFEHIDIYDSTAVARVFTERQPDAVMHLAAEPHVDRSIIGPAACIETNILGTCTLLEATCSYWQSLDDVHKAALRFYHISTDEVYGALEATDDLFTETTSYVPGWPNSSSKASSDHLVRPWHCNGLPTLITNCWNNYGPCHFPEKLIPLVILNALEGKPLAVYGKGNQIRDWLYVQDHARALYKVVTDGVVGEACNIGGHNEKPNIDVVHAICELPDELRLQAATDFGVCDDSSTDD